MGLLEYLKESEVTAYGCPYRDRTGPVPYGRRRVTQHTQNNLAVADVALYVKCYPIFCNTNDVFAMSMALMMLHGAYAVVSPTVGVKAKEDAAPRDR
jgi:hypothetical protein